MIKWLKIIEDKYLQRSLIFDIKPFNPFSTGKIENLDFKIPIIPHTSKNINKQKTTSANSINLDIIRKLIEYSLKKVRLKAMFTLAVFEILLYEGRSGHRERKG